MAESADRWHSSEAVGVVASAGAFGLFAVKLMAVSHGSVNTAKALLQTSSLGESLLGVALSGLLPMACAGAFLFALLRLGDVMAAQRGLDGEARVWLVSAVVLAFVIGYLISLAWAVGGVVLLVALVALRRRLRGETGRSLRRVLVVAALVPSAVFLIDDSVWLPYERFERRDGTAVVGYTVAEDEDVLVVLRDRDRVIQRVPRDDVAERDYCVPDYESWVGRSFSEVAKAKLPKYPLCPRGRR